MTSARSEAAQVAALRREIIAHAEVEAEALHPTHEFVNGEILPLIYRRMCANLDAQGDPLWELCKRMWEQRLSGAQPREVNGRLFPIGTIMQLGDSAHVHANNARPVQRRRWWKLQEEERRRDNKKWIFKAQRNRVLEEHQRDDESVMACEERLFASGILRSKPVKGKARTSGSSAKGRVPTA